jgi:hypothetical protein
MGLAAILALINAVEPLIGNLIIAIKGKAGMTDIAVVLDSADASFDANQKVINDWLVSKGKPPLS